MSYPLHCYKITVTNSRAGLHVGTWGSLSLAVFLCAAPLVVRGVSSLCMPYKVEHGYELTAVANLQWRTDHWPHADQRAADRAPSPIILKSATQRISDYILQPYYLPRLWVIVKYIVSFKSIRLSTAGLPMVLKPTGTALPWLRSPLLQYYRNIIWNVPVPMDITAVAITASTAYSSNSQSSALCELYWLALKYRIQFKLAVFTHQVTMQRCPSYA